MTLRLFLFFLPLPLAAQSLYNIAPDTGRHELPTQVNLGTIAIGFDDSPGQSSPHPRNFFFGDSLSDTGNVSDFLGTLGSGYPGNSFTNGRTWVEYLQPNIRRILASIESSPDSPILDLSESLDLSAGGSTTSTVLNQQVRGLFLPASGLVNAHPSDRAFIWAGGNDLLPFYSNTLPPDQASLTSTISAGVSNFTQSVAALDSAGIPNITVISLLNLGLSPRGQVLPGDGSQISDSFNTQLRNSLGSLPISANLLWIDSDAFINKIVANPATYGFTNVTDAAAPFASDGIPSSLSPEEQAGYLFYDDIHPTTETHRQFSLFVSEHLNLESDAQDLSLLTDSALILDDRFGFDSSPLVEGKADLNVAAFFTENQIGPRRRKTSGVKADYDYALTDQFLLGGEFFYADGDSGQTSLESMGVALDTVYQGSFSNLKWETGLGAGLTWGDLTRRYLTPGFRAVSEQRASTFSAHAALKNPNCPIGPLNASWEIGLKQRLVRPNSSRESGAASLNLHYESETLSTTVANFELGLNLLPNLDLQLALNPVLFHHGGEITASQRDGLASFSTADRSGFDIHTARTSLIFSPGENSTISTHFIIGSDQLWATNLSFQLRF